MKGNEVSKEVKGSQNPSSETRKPSHTENMTRQQDAKASSSNESRHFGTMGKPTDWTTQEHKETKTTNVEDPRRQKSNAQANQWTNGSRLFKY